MLIGVICTLVLIILVVGIVILVRARQDEKENYYTAAHNILKEEQLDLLLKNPYKKGLENGRNSIKPMLFLKFLDKSKQKYVFCLEKEVCIGRDKDKNQVCVNEPIVSHCHCKISSNGSNVYLQDLYSSNGIEVKRGISRYAFGNGDIMEIFTKDVIKIGTTRIKVIVFYFDTTMM